MPPKRNKDKRRKSKGENDHKGETTNTADDTTATVTNTNENLNTETDENFTLNTEESKQHEDQQTVEIPDNQEEVKIEEDTTEPQTEYSAPPITEETKVEETPVIEEEVKVVEETTPPTIQSETTNEETTVEETKKEDILPSDEPKSLHEAIAEESQQQGVAAEEQREAGTVEAEVEKQITRDTIVNLVKKEDAKERTDETVFVDENGSQHVNQDSGRSDVNATGRTKEEPYENIAGNEHKIEHLIEGLKEQSILKQPDAVHQDPAIPDIPEETSHVEGKQELPKVEEFPPLVVEPEVKIVDHPPQENKDVLTSSVRSEWEEIKPHSGNENLDQTVQASVLGGSQISERSQEPNLLHSHVVVEDKIGSSVDLQGSLQKNWDLMVNKPAEDAAAKDKVYDQEEDFRSDKASDHAHGTRLMDDYTESHNKGSQPQLIEISERPESLTQEERLRQAEYEIGKAKTLKAENRPEEAIILLQTARELLNPDHFSKEQTVLNQVNEKIMDCTLETSDCYNQLNDFPQSIKYAKAIRKSHPENIRAIYLLGIGLVRVGELETARAILKESKHYAAPSGDTLYLNMIDKELEKLDQIAESRSQLKRNSSHEDETQPLLVHKPGSVDEVPVEEKPELSPEKKNREEKPTAGNGASAAEYFLGSLVSSGALSFVIAKYLFKYPTKKGIIASLVIGAVVGGVSLIAQSALRKSHKK